MRIRSTTHYTFTDTLGSHATITTWTWVDGHKDASPMLSTPVVAAMLTRDSAAIALMQFRHRITTIRRLPREGASS